MEKGKRKIWAQNVVQTVVFVVVSMGIIASLSVLVTDIMGEFEYGREMDVIMLIILLMCVIIILIIPGVKKGGKMLQVQCNIVWKISFIIEIVSYVIFSRALLQNVPLIETIGLTRQIYNIIWWAIVVNFFLKFLLWLVLPPKEKEKREKISEEGEEGS